MLSQDAVGLLDGHQSGELTMSYFEWQQLEQDVIDLFHVRIQGGRCHSVVGM